MSYGPHPHPLRCHPPSPESSPLIGAARDGGKQTMCTSPLSAEYLLTDSSTCSSQGAEVDDADEDNCDQHLGALTYGGPIPQDGRRFLDFFGLPGVNGQTVDTIHRAVLRVFDYLPSKSDERSFTFVDKSTFNFLLPKLYHTVTIDIARFPHNLQATMGMVCKTNPGRQFIRRVIFDGDDVADKRMPPSGFTYLASHIISQLPEYQLESFEWPADFVLPEFDTLDLWDRQDTVKNIAIYQHTLSYSPQDTRDALDAMDNLEVLRISVDDSAGIRPVYLILKHHPIRDLHLDLRTYKPKLCGKRSVAEDVSQLVFKHMQPLTKCPVQLQLALTRLTLWHVDLENSHGSWLHCIRPMSLKEVELVQCPFVGHFLHHLADRHPCIHSVRIDHDEQLDVPAPAMTTGRKARTDHEVLEHTFTDSLCKFLVDLAFAREACQDPAPWAGTEPRQRLKRLRLCIENAVCTTTYEEAVKLHLPNLELLSLKFVSDADDDSSEIFSVEACFESCEPLLLRQLDISFQSFKRSEKCFNPVTLRLHGVVAENGHTAAAHALYALRTAHKKNLQVRVIAIEIQPREYVTLDRTGKVMVCKSRMEYFTRGECIVMGKKVETVVPVSFAQVKKYATEIEVLKLPPAKLGAYGRV
ncbi:uncharacterized protein PV09_04158 [Verruconis gallopava]|uniref:Uncharacterized protein n=1 Tax=Verruconis gallopava TaxID=253628 RepID=A0A0D2B123_9PEZI|nr:uncharacterized protein PV09_04158 [Verruconis gallopava]KIW04999.1 hypothetical protein PV09_04158 [Verruconis gallopava]